MTTTFSDISTKAEQSLVDYLQPLTEQDPLPEYLQSVSVQVGVSNDEIHKPVVICFSDHCQERIYGTGIYDCRCHVQLQSTITDGADKYKLRVAAVEDWLFNPDQGTGNYNLLSAALTDTDKNFHVIGVLPGEMVSTVANDDSGVFWVYDRQLTLVCEWVNLDDSSSSSSDSSDSSSSSSS